MSLITLIWQQHRFAFIKVILLNLLNALVNVAIIAFINRYLIAKVSESSGSWQILGIFLLAIVGLLTTTFISQLALTKLGHRFVFELRSQLIKRILDTSIAQVEKIGSAKLLASLSTDIQSITVAFVRLPELVQGVIICVATAVYLGFLSVPMLLVVIGCIAVTVLISSQLVRHVYVHLANIRDINDELYEDYQSVIEGRKELALNRERAKRLFEQDYQRHANDYYDHIVKADTFHLSAVSWSNIMMFAIIGVIYALANIYHWVDTATATTFALTVLFIQSPLLMAIGAFPTVQTAKVALEKIQSLQLADYQAEFNTQLTHPNWQMIEMKNARYHYDNASNFSLKNINFSLKRGEVVFLIGANGSGKSTFAKLITGLYQPNVDEQNSGIYVDNQLITATDYDGYRQLFSAIYSDFHLFKTVMGQGDNAPNDELIDNWLNILAIKQKVTLTNHQLSTTELSQGQRKRLAMLLAIAEEKSILLLDEWAADQDPAYRRVFYHDIIPMLQQMGKTLLIISHDDSYFERADRLLLMKNGELSELTGMAREQASHDAIGVI
ncbi:MULTISPECIES: multidrug ABC transporter permease/ATP-binding protein [unclassified Moraxella]|uniref:multidrug ABC transporter permease/ATP-binding protein n=1 Tax=unclassified Moraxella TaxID=2685852 RepID=UPI003AF64D59